MTEGTTRVDGRQIRYLEEGQGQPIVLLHGASLGSSSDGFQCNLKPLAAAGLRAIAPDRPGYGLSDGPMERSMPGHRQFVLGFLDALGIGSAILVGHSQQGGVAAQLVLDHPHRAPRAIILGGGAVLPPAPEGGDAEGEGERLEKEPTPEWTRLQLQANLYNHDLITPEAIEVRHRMSLGQAFRHYVERPAPAPGGSPAAPGEPIWRRVGANPEPFLLMFGRQDKPTTEVRCRLAMEQFPKLRLLLLDRCSHLVMWDHADEFVRQTIAFAQAGVLSA